MPRTDPQTAEAYPLGTHLAEELRERHMTAADLAKAACMNPSRVQAILDGAKVTYTEADLIGRQLLVPTSLLLNLQMAWIQWQGKQQKGAKP
jgi:plasmid maintenance system antidote protein VapI